MSAVDWESWLVENAGAAVIKKEAASGHESLTPAERLTYCLWIADYGMRNAGDLETARDLHADFQSEALSIANDMGLTKTAEAFGLAPDELEGTFFDRFDEICAEVAEALERQTEWK